MGDLTTEQQIDFRNQFRRGRAIAYKDAENFHELLYALERLGLVLTGPKTGLTGYGDALKRLAASSALACEIPDENRAYHSPFDTLFSEIVSARNDAMHEGAFARHLATNVSRLALMIEDALMVGNSKVTEFMVRDPLGARGWQPVSFVRQKMLENSFSFLPIYIENRGWHFISEYSIAKFLRNTSQKRRDLLATRVEDAIASGDLKVEIAKTCEPATSVDEAARILENAPLLVVVSESDAQLLGIITAFDIM